MDHLVILNGWGVGSSGCLGTQIACRAVQAPLLVTVLSWRGAVGLVPFTLLGAAEGVHPPGSSLEAVPWSHGEPAQPGSPWLVLAFLAEEQKIPCVPTSQL